MMNAATMALLVLKGWNRLLALSFLGTVAFYWGWYWQFYAPAAFVTTTVFLSFFILLFAAATILARHRRVHPEQDEYGPRTGEHGQRSLRLPRLLRHAVAQREWTQHRARMVLVGFGTFYLGVRKWMERTPIAGSRLASLSDVQLSIAIVFLTLAVPLAVHGHWVTGGLDGRGRRADLGGNPGRQPLDAVSRCRSAGVGAHLAGDGCHHRPDACAVEYPFPQLRCIDDRDGDCNRAGTSGGESRSRPTNSGPSWKLLAQIGAVVANALVIIAVLEEIHTYWWSGPPPAAGLADLRTPGSLLSSAIWLMAASGALMWAALRGKPMVRAFTLQLAESICWGLAALILLCIGMVYPQQLVVWNLRFVAFAVAIAAAMWAARHSSEESPARGSQIHIAASVLATVLVLTAICFEISTFWSTRPLLAAPGSVMYASQVAGRQMAERFSYSAWFLLAGAALLVFGFRRRSALLRWQALVLLAVTICKVFLLDTSTLSQGYRIVSFLALGVLLLAVSFAYQRDWLHLRAVGATETK